MTGVVVERDETKMRVRVQFAERDGLPSDWLPVLQQKTLGDFEVWLPDLGSHVACLMDQHYEDGVVLGCIYSDADLPPIADPDVFHRQFSDGTVLQYNRKTHILVADVKGEIQASADVSVTVTSPLVKAVASSQVIHDTPLTVCTGNLSVAGGITCTGTYGASGGKISTPGDIQSTGGDVKDKTRSMAGDRAIYNDHTHNDPQGGAVGQPNQGM